MMKSFLPLGAITTALGAVFAYSALAQTMTEGTTRDGATYGVPSEWVAGHPLTISGGNWLTEDDRGSVIGVKYDRGAVIPDTVVDFEFDDIWARIAADEEGNFITTIPFPDGAGWDVGEEHSVHLLTGSIAANDLVRNPAITVTIVAAQ